MKFYNSWLVKLIFFIVFVTVVHSKRTKPASAYFNTLCRRSDADLGECVKNVIMGLKPQLMKGIPALGLVPLEPLIIPRMELNEGSGRFGLNTTFTNLTIQGLGDYTIQSSKVKLDDLVYENGLVMNHPVLRMKALYSIDGQILVLPIRGEGDSELNFTDVTTTCLTRGRIVERNGERYIDVQSVSWDIRINGKFSMLLNNLFNGDKQLGDATNKFLNENSKEAFEVFKHLPEEGFGELFKANNKKVFDVFPVNELFVE